MDSDATSPTAPAIASAGAVRHPLAADRTPPTAWSVTPRSWTRVRCHIAHLLIDTTDFAVLGDLKVPSTASILQHPTSSI